ncbi:cleavage stimulation factor subunit 3-like isoform X1 [Dermacentor silvarum]|uniref:cleavage stimulation factor subunit 3-like isoform X1 n=1 Tax=Dermacentor silvarum TaxID=543639 RepID=UPI00189A8243|nr:cleavage stimulation factor subunit 3-like isoform X1 [Dermacentor silvarum]
MFSGPGSKRESLPQMEGYIPDRVKNAEKRLEQNVYDVEAWSILLRDAQNKKVEEARPLYEKIVTQFPNAGRYWKIYIEHEMKSRNFERVEKLFQRCLMKVLNIDLWRCYLTYVKETKGSLPTYREKMAQAYDFALDKMGMDILSYPVWSDYINFLKSVEAVGSYAENQRITAVRKVYQRGIINPMMNIEQLWKEYINYEQGINMLIAEKMISDRSREYMNARRVAKEYEAVTRGLNKNSPSVPPQGTPEEAKQVELWKKYIAWEKSNPLRTDDHALITKRVMFAYEQCLLCLGHHPDVWYEAALFLEQSSKLLTDKGDLNAGKLFSDEAAAIYERATTTLLRKNTLLYFAYADFEESRMKHDKVHQVYNKFIEIPDIDPTLAYVQYMKFARRAEGIKTARVVFKKAREDARSGHQVYVAAALMEYYCSKEKTVAFKIFELGLKKYGDNSDYIMAYVDYLSHLNEDNNTRVLFERVLTSGSLPPEKSVEIWNRFLEFESNIGDLSSILKVEKRRAAAIEKLKEFEGKETALLVDRYRFMDLYPCSPQELKSLGYRDVTRLPVVVSSAPASKREVREETATDKQNPVFPRPDTGQMIPFKPKQICPTGAHLVPGGVFPPPPAASELMMRLPPPHCFMGPFAAVDELMEVFRNMNLPEKPPRPSENGVSKDHLKLFEHSQAASLQSGNPGGGGGVKRKHRDGAAAGVGGGTNAGGAGAEESEEEDGGLAPPAHDIYRSRQQKKSHTSSMDRRNKEWWPTQEAVMTI